MNIYEETQKQVKTVQNIRIQDFVGHGKNSMKIVENRWWVVKNECICAACNI